MKQDSASRSAADAGAREAVLWTMPLFEMARSRAAMCPRRDPAGRFAGDGADAPLRWINQLVHSRRLLTPANRQVVTPNNDTLYTSAWLDLSGGPLLIEVPAFGDRYYVLGLLDFWTNPFGSIGTRSSGSGAGRFLLRHAGGGQGGGTARRVAAKGAGHHDGAASLGSDGGTTMIDCPTPIVWMIGRLMVGSEAELPAVHALQDRIRLTRPDGSPASCRFDVGQPGIADVRAPRRYAEVVNRALADAAPVPDGQEGIAARCAALGLGAGIDAATLDEATLARLADGLRQVLDELSRPRASDLGGGWFLPLAVGDSFGDDFLTRAHVSRNFIGALGVEEAMYVTADVDADGQPLDGRHAYRLRFPPGGLPRVGAFWSITLYDKPDCMLVDNPLGRHSIGDRSPQLRPDPDGGLTLWFGATSPADPAQQGNWLPAPAAPFYLTMRLYLPQAPHLQRRFVYPPVCRA